MAVDAELAQGLRAVQRILGSPAFAELASDQEQLKACHDDPEGTLRGRGIALPECVKRVEMRVRHTPPLARERGLRGGNFEWRFSLQVGGRSWRVIHLCDAWPLDAGDTGEGGRRHRSGGWECVLLAGNGGRDLPHGGTFRLYVTGQMRALGGAHG